MNDKQFLKCFLTIMILICAQVTGWARNNNVPAMQEDVVLQWNRVLMETVLTPGQHPATIMQVRSYAMMHAAIFDAVNSIDGSHSPYLIDVPGSQNASIEAAQRKRRTMFWRRCIRLACRSLTLNWQFHFRGLKSIEHNKESGLVKSSPSDCWQLAPMTAGR